LTWFVPISQTRTSWPSCDTITLISGTAGLKSKLTLSRFKFSSSVWKYLVLTVTSNQRCWVTLIPINYWATITQPVSKFDTWFVHSLFIGFIERPFLSHTRQEALDNRATQIVACQWATPLFYIRDFPKSHQANVEVLPQIRPLRSTFLPTHYSVTILQFNTIYSELQKSP
jgi:hypothetical protein